MSDKKLRLVGETDFERIYKPQFSHRQKIKEVKSERQKEKGTEETEEKERVRK
jgi:hypothetical protein